MVWDAEGNLESVTEAGKTTSFIYDAEGDRPRTCSCCSTAAARPTPSRSTATAPS
ncbi:RHS repeat domain-containing protein [Nonomuraea wenchangensis]